ncbi:hypothetical protein CDL15_Pgr002648 [Punica granatum]|uniref:ARID domain-containing protein n=2 Tax=Punica granatum TaxID=22663 RepID=A0A218W2S8_PUNGR|nr:hypothetical protein CDL15_Pgr002648 [Punica granatum]
MLHTRGASRDVCGLLAVKCCKVSQRSETEGIAENKHGYGCPFPEQVSSGHLEVHSLTSPSKDEFCRALESYKPSFVYFRGEYLEDNEVGSLVLGGVDYNYPEAISELFPTALPVGVYLEIPNGEEHAKALQSKGVPYVIYWKNFVPAVAASHFYYALCSLLRSSAAHIWDAFQLAYASYRLYCLRKLNVSSEDDNFGIHLLGNAPEIDVFTPEVEVEEDREGSLSTLPTIKIHDDEVNVRFLVCGGPCTSDEISLGSLEDGLNAILTTEIRGSKLIGKFSVLQPLIQTETFSRDVVTMRCDVSTSSCAHVSFLLSGNAQICFDDQLLENHIKKEIIEKSQLVHAPTNFNENRVPTSEPRLSASVACGAKVFEVIMNVPAWASQVLRQLALDPSHHGLVALGIASIQGMAVASFDMDDAERLLFFCSAETEDSVSPTDFGLSPRSTPVWLRPPVPSRKRPERSQTTSPHFNSEQACSNGSQEDGEKSEGRDWARQRLKAAALRPIPRIHPRKIQLFLRTSQRDGFDEGQARDGSAVPPVRQRVIRPASLAYRRSSAKSFQSRQMISLNPLPLKKHGCDRSAIQHCSEEEFLKDVMHFLTIRGHSRLIPQGGFAEFPDAILNAKRLDLYNLYKEVVSRGGFHVGNGINWKGQVFSKMSNYTTTHRMTGVGNTLKRHYETYLLEYELAHDDVDGECCLICHSGAAGDWVNCGACGEWAHFGCDRRQGLGAFKDYAKTDGLEYICPQCSMTNSKKKQQLQRPTNGFSKAY